MELDDYQNWQRAKQIKAKYQAKIANKRKDYLHKARCSEYRCKILNTTKCSQKPPSLFGV